MEKTKMKIISLALALVGTILIIDILAFGFIAEFAESVQKKSAINASDLFNGNMGHVTIEKADTTLIQATAMATGIVLVIVGGTLYLKYAKQ